jgi:hypothetical protein
MHIIVKIIADSQLLLRKVMSNSSLFSYSCDNSSKEENILAYLCYRLNRHVVTGVVVMFFSNFHTV